MKGQLSRKADRRQAQVENPLALLGTALALLEHDTLRVRQAIRRGGMDDLLSPVVEDHRLIAQYLKTTQGHLRALWDEGQGKRWK
jgi:hypothetical protein